MTVADRPRAPRQPRPRKEPRAKATSRTENDARERARLLAELPGRLRLASTRPDDAQPLLSLSLSYSRLARLDDLHSPGAPPRWLEKDLAVREKIADLEPGDDLAAAQLASGLWRLARALRRKDPVRARSLLVRALEIRDRLADEAPDDAHRAQTVALTCSGLGRLDGRTDPSRGKTCRRWPGAMVSASPVSSRRSSRIVSRPTGAAPVRKASCPVNSTACTSKGQRSGAASAATEVPSA